MLPVELVPARPRVSEVHVDDPREVIQRERACIIGRQGFRRPEHALESGEPSPEACVGSGRCKTCEVGGEGRKQLGLGG